MNHCESPSKVLLQEKNENSHTANCRTWINDIIKILWRKLFASINKYDVRIFFPLHSGWEETNFRNIKNSTHILHWLVPNCSRSVFSIRIQQEMFGVFRKSSNFFSLSPLHHGESLMGPFSHQLQLVYPPCSAINNVSNPAATQRRRRESSREFEFKSRKRVETSP